MILYYNLIHFCINRFIIPINAHINGRISASTHSQITINISNHTTMKLVNVFVVLTILGTAAAFSLTMSAGPVSTTNGIVQSSSTSPAAGVNRRSFVRSTTAGVAGAALVQGGILDLRPAVAEDGDFVTTESGLQYKVVTEGTGAIPQPGQTVKVSGMDSVPSSSTGEGIPAHIHAAEHGKTHKVPPPPSHLIEQPSSPSLKGALHGMARWI